VEEKRAGPVPLVTEKGSGTEKGKKNIETLYVPARLDGWQGGQGGTVMRDFSSHGPALKGEGPRSVQRSSVKGVKGRKKERESSFTKGAT